MENESKLNYEIKVTLKDGSYYQYKTDYSWDVREEKFNDTRRQFCDFDDGRFIVARESILKIETRNIENDDEKGANNEN